MEGPSLAYETLTYEQDRHVVTLTYNRPDQHNAVNRKMNSELHDAWQRFRDDDDAFVLVSDAPMLTPLTTAPSFEDFSMAFYLPPEPYDANEHITLPDLDAALLGGPERNYDWHSDDFLL